MNVNSYDDISVKSGTSLLPKVKNKPRSFTINSSFPSLSIDTSFSRLKKRKPSKVDMDLLHKVNGPNNNSYYQSEDDPTSYSLYARNKLLEATYNLLCDTSDNTNYAFEFSKLIEIQWFSYFINKNTSPTTLILIMRIITKLLQTQNYQYRLAFKNTYKMYKLLNINIPKYFKVGQIYHSLLALTFETPINSIPLNSPFDLATLKKLYKNVVQINNNAQYNTDSLIAFLKMIKEIIRINIEDLNRNQDKIDYSQFNNKNSLNQNKLTSHLQSINQSPINSPIQTKLLKNMHEKHESSYDNLNINITKQQSSGSISLNHSPYTPSTPRTPRTPRTPLVNLSNPNNKKDFSFEDESSLYIYQNTDDFNKKLNSSIQFIENIFSFFLHLFSINNKKIKLLFSENAIINELMDIMFVTVNNQISLVDTPFTDSHNKTSNIHTHSLASIDNEKNKNENYSIAVKSTEIISHEGLNETDNDSLASLHKIKERFELPIYNLIIAMATSSIAEDWKPLYALNNILNTLSNYTSNFKHTMSVSIYKHVINKLLLISDKNIDMLLDSKIINNIFKFLNNTIDFIYIDDSVKLAKNILKFLCNIISKIRGMNTDKYNGYLSVLYKTWNRTILFFFFEDRTKDELNYLVTKGIDIKNTLVTNENVDQDFFNCLLLNLYNIMIANDKDIDPNLIQAWTIVVSNRLQEFRKVIRLKSDDKIADDEIKILSESILPNINFNAYIRANQMVLSELFSNYISYSWKTFKSQEQNKISDYNKKLLESSEKLVSPRSIEDAEEKEEINNLQLKIFERLKMIQDRTVISAKKLLIDKMETSKVLEIEWSKIIYNLFREKAIWEKETDEIKYWKLDFTEAPDRTRQKLRLNLNFDKELLKLNNESESDASSVYSMERKQSNSSSDSSKIRNNFVKNKTEVADYLKKSMETQQRIKENIKLKSQKGLYDSSFINIPPTPAVGNKQNFVELVALHKSESPKQIKKEISEDASVANEMMEEDPTNILNDINEIVESTDNLMDDTPNTNEKEPLTTNSDLNNITNDISPTSPEEKNAINNINERISRLIDQNEDRNFELYNTARIKGLDICEGLLILGESNIYFIENYLKRGENEIDNVSNIPIEERNPFYIVLISSTQQDVLKNSKTEQYTYDYIKWSQSNIVDIKKRRFIFRNVGIEFFLSNGRSYLFTFENKERDTVYNKLYYKINSNVSNKDTLLENDDDLSPSFGIKIPLLSDYYTVDKIRKKWEKRKISNFEYLFTLNTLAGRSYNDLTQYPIFPWILSNYESSKIDLENPANYRDLSKPMGAQDEERALKIKERYDHWEDPEGKPAFHYGTHYSSAMIVCTYLMRLEPFTDQYLKLQGGHFDHADRLFFSIDRTWKSSSKENTTDVRELIPEFYYLPDFFINSNGFDLGMKHDKTRIDNVVLPTWACNDPRLFVFIHRQALESEYVSSNLHKWIDLIFGYKQQGEEAVNALNVFYHLSYEGAVNIDDIKDPIERVSTINIIHNFGQTPSQLFKEPHPPRQEKTNEIQFLLSSHYDYLVSSSFPIKTIEDPVGEIDYISDSRYFVLNQYQTMIPNNLKYVEWNYLDKCVRVCNYENNKVLYSSDILHTSDITCLKFADQDTMITGGSDMVICIWKATFNKLIKFTLQSILRGHKSPITCLNVSRKHSIILSSSAHENYVIVWDLNRYIFVHSLPIKEKLLTCEISDIWGNIVLCCSSVIYIYSINGELLVEHTITSPVLSCAVYDCTEFGNTMTTIVTGHKNGLIRIWNYSYNISEKTQTVKWDIFLCRTIETNMSSITALTIPSSHRFILAGDNKGVIYPWIMLDGSGTTLHYNVSEDACKACNNKFAVFDRFKIRCVGCGYFYCNECTFGIQQFEKDNKICKFCLKKISDIDNRENEENNHTSSLSLSEELIVEPSTQDLFQSVDVNDNNSNQINDTENEINNDNNNNDNNNNDNKMSNNDSNTNDHNINKNNNDYNDSPIIKIINVSNENIDDKKNESIDENGINNDKMEEKKNENNETNIESHPLNNENNENKITDTNEAIDVKENNKTEDGTPIIDIKINKNITENTNTNTSNDKANELMNIIHSESQHELQQ